MSGWIKMGVGLRRHLKVVRISSALNADRLRVIGALHAVWCLFDEHSTEGHLNGYTQAILDDEIGWHGFAAAMASVGWLDDDGSSLAVPTYEEHNGPTAKRRALDSQRKGQIRRLSADCPQVVRIDSGTISASEADTLRNREEEIREEKKKKKKEAPPCVGVTVLVLAGFDESTAVEFIAHKAKLKAPLTVRAWADHQAEAAKAGWTPLAAAVKVMAKSWKGFEAKYVASEHRPGSGGSTAVAAVPEWKRNRAHHLAVTTGGLLGKFKDEPETFDVAAKRIG